MIRVNLLIGCTACGKSPVALELARRLGGEILSVDSMKIYRRMDIGTAKPTPRERQCVPHHLVDIVEPHESYSLGRFMEDADRVIHEIAERGKPIVAEGGTMMFVRGLLSGVFKGPPADPDFRHKLRARAAREGTEALHGELARIDPAAADRIHPNDLRRVERALEVYHATGQPITRLQTQWESAGGGPYDCRVAAIRRERETINRRINARVRSMIDAGLVDEVRSLLADPTGIGEQAAQAVGYAEIIRHLRGELTLEEAVEQIKANTRRLAKAQRTWIRRMPGVRWLDASDSDTVEFVADRLWALWDTSSPAS
ncbi:MAG TPA: tRNA (adenosine(37)-N6)-dimethylallyltransferase MiaA [Phycisphaerae bacterium]|nr:tRNA (adenosine(37)-N6)-dimethylallyltransferase MiaA [Phycisphaerae bacterium]